MRKMGEEDNGDIDLATVYDYLAFAEYKVGKRMVIIYFIGMYLHS